MFLELKKKENLKNQVYSYGCTGSQTELPYQLKEGNMPSETRDCISGVAYCEIEGDLSHLSIDGLSLVVFLQIQTYFLIKS